MYEEGNKTMEQEKRKLDKFLDEVESKIRTLGIFTRKISDINDRFESQPMEKGDNKEGLEPNDYFHKMDSIDSKLSIMLGNLEKEIAKLESIV